MKHSDLEILIALVMLGSSRWFCVSATIACAATMVHPVNTIASLGFVSLVTLSGGIAAAGKFDVVKQKLQKAIQHDRR